MKVAFLSLLFISTLLLNSYALAAPRGISKQQAANIATQQHPGRVLGIKRKEDVYRVKTLSKSGKVRVINIDAHNGNIKSGKKPRR